jgi:hypothetical protein
VIHLALLLLALAAFVALCLGDARRQVDLLGRKLAPGAAVPLACGGWLLLALGSVAAIAGLGAYGVVEWAGFLSLGAAVVVLTLSWRCARR